MSDEPQTCPCCGGKLKKVRLRERRYRDEDGEQHTILIMQYRCISCRKYHIGLPGFLIPYKHYEAKVIQAVVDNEKDDEGNLKRGYIAISEITIARWDRWYEEEVSPEAVAVLIRGAPLDAGFQETSSLLDKFKAAHRIWIGRIVMKILLWRMS